MPENSETITSRINRELSKRPNERPLVEKHSPLPRDIISSEYVEDIQISAHELEEKEDLLVEINNLVQEIGEEFESYLEDAMEEYGENTRYTSNRQVIEKLVGREIMKPRFKIFGISEGKEFLEDMGYPYEQLEGDNVLVVFNLPKPLSQYWWKGEGDWGEGGIDIDESAVEWGKFYREIMPIVWNKQDDFRFERDMTFYRINDISDHEPNEFYYIWEIGKASDRDRIQPEVMSA